MRLSRLAAVLILLVLAATPVLAQGRRGTEEGTAYVHFFPAGQAQRAFVPVVDGKNLYTVVVEPFTGRARVVVGAVEVRE